MRTLLAHTIVLTPFITLETKSQREIDIVGIVPARQCHGSGARLRMAAMKDATGSSRCMIARWIRMGENEENGSPRPRSFLNNL